MAKEADQKLIEQLKLELAQKSAEVAGYKTELTKISQKLDSLLSNLQNESDLLAKVHRALVPTEIPRIPGFEFSRKFLYGSQSGGDYFDIFEHEDKFKFGVIISSSSGYAMSALFLSLILKTSPMLEAKKGASPHALLLQMAKELAVLANDTDYTNVFYAVVDRRDYTVRFCGLGNTAVFYMTKDKVLKQLTNSTGPIVKSYSDTPSTGELELQPHSKLCFATQGLVDVLGNDTISRILSEKSKAGVHDIRNEILFQAQRKTGLEVPLRDQTVVIIEIKDLGLKLAKT